MRATRKLFILLVIATLISAVAMLAADKKSKSKKNAPETGPAQMNEDKKVLHSLNRFTFGPRPGDLETIRGEGLDKWFEEQLHPDKINNSQLEAKLTPFRTLKMSTSEMVENFPPPQVVRALENGRMSLPSDPGKRAIYESRMAAYEQRQKNKEQAIDADMKADMKDAQGDEQLTPEQRNAGQKQREARMFADVDSVQ